MEDKSFFHIEIKVDVNDADYITKKSLISQGDLEKINPLIVAIKNFKPYIGKSKSGVKFNYHHNYPHGECFRPDLGEKSGRELYQFDDKLFEMFEELLPSSAYGFHTIKSIHIYPYVEVEKTKLL